MLPEWSKGLHLRCTVFALAGSNPAHSSLTFPFFGLNAALRPLRFDAIQVFFKGPALWPFEPNHKEHVQCPHLEAPTTAPCCARREPPGAAKRLGSQVGSHSVQPATPPRVVNIVVRRQRSVAPPPSVTTSAPRAALIDTHTGSTYTQVPRPASRPCQRPRATCAPATRVPAGGEISTNITRGSPHVVEDSTTSCPFTIALRPIFMNVIESDPPR